MDKSVLVLEFNKSPDGHTSTTNTHTHTQHGHIWYDWSHGRPNDWIKHHIWTTSVRIDNNNSKILHWNGEQRRYSKQRNKFELDYVPFWSIGWRNMTQSAIHWILFGIPLIFVILKSCSKAFDYEIHFNNKKYTWTRKKTTISWFWHRFYLVDFIVEYLILSEQVVRRAPCRRCE